jgi:FkbM family methyltransferase
VSDNFKPLDSYRFTMDAIDTLEQLADFKIWRAGESDYHPSFYSFLDELDVRAEWWHPKRGDVVCDVGADYGSYTLPALAAGADVVAWSPAFKTSKGFEAAVLERSAKANDFEWLTLYTNGLWSEPGWLKASDWSKLAEYHSRRPEGDIVFSVSTLDHQSPKPVDWLKIDAEGAELHILQGGEQTIRRSRPRILLEHHLHIDPHCRARCTDFLDALDLGYKSQGYRPHGAIAHEFFTCE